MSIFPKKVNKIKPSLGDLFHKKEDGARLAFEQGLVDEQRTLKDDFYKEFEVDIAYNLLDSLAAKALASNYQLIGEGYHFHSYLSNRFKRLRLVYSVAKPTFKQGLPSAISKWRNLLSKLRRLGLKLPLIPPIEVIERGGMLCYVTPYADGDIDKVSKQWLPLEDHVKHLQEGLKDNGLMLDDYIQVKSVSGLPIVIDWSDLVVSNL